MAIDPSYPGTVKCLDCGKPFESPDRIRIRRCSGCKDKAKKHQQNNRGKTYVYHGPATGLD